MGPTPPVGTAVSVDDTLAVPTPDGAAGVTGDKPATTGDEPGFVTTDAAAPDGVKDETAPVGDETAPVGDETAPVGALGPPAP